MTMNDTAQSDAKGSLAYENWKLSSANAPLKSTLEYPLFTDAHIIGTMPEFETPYELMNVVPVVDAPTLAPAIVLRMDYYAGYDSSPQIETNVERYHGGGISDEIAALVSLCLGVRLKAGGFTRYFELGKDPKGRPVSWNLQDNPVLFKTARRVVVPQALGEHNLAEAALLARFTELPADGSIALVRAARLYQDALWTAESEPSLSWVMLVSSVEAAANYWRPRRESPIDRLRLFDPALEQKLVEVGGNELAEFVAGRIAGFMGSTRKFIDFILEYLPDPPPRRPPDFYQHSWEREVMGDSLKKIYKWRSFALHRGIPFPVPMCEPPGRGGDYFEEVPLGLATGVSGAKWATEDAPMLLHTFEHIVRNSLLNWWRSMCTLMTLDV